MYVFAMVGRIISLYIYVLITTGFRIICNCPGSAAVVVVSCVCSGQPRSASVSRGTISVGYVSYMSPPMCVLGASTRRLMDKQFERCNDARVVNIAIRTARLEL